MANNNHFSLTLDTLAPTGSISRGDHRYAKENFALSITKGDATFMYVWFDGSASTSTIPDTAKKIPAADSYTTAFSVSGNYYYHVVLEDSVGNKSSAYHTDIITYDIVAPEVTAAKIRKRDHSETELVNTRDVEIYFTFADAPVSSGIVSFAVSGDVASYDTTALTADEITAGAAYRNIVLSGSGAEDVDKTVSVTVTDAAGNTSAPTSDTIRLDTTGAIGTLVLRDAADTKNIDNTWVNSEDFKISISCTDSDWAAYRIAGDFQGSAASIEAAEWVTVTAAQVSAKNVKVDQKFTAGDSSAKNVYAQIKDTAGNVTTLTSTLAKVDYSAPTVSIVCDKTYVSLVTGYNTAVFTPTVDASISGAKSFQWYLNGSAFGGSGASGSGAPVALTVSASDLGDGGAKASKEFTLKVIDNAGNETTSTGVVLYLDTVAPTGTITMSAWYNRDDADHTTYSAFSSAGATASASDEGAGLGFMTCWCSQTAQDTTVVGTQIAYAANPTHAQIDWTGHGESATNYIHIEYVDNVGNKAIIHSSAFGIDTVVPTDGAVTFEKRAYNTTSAAVTLTRSDATSGVAQFKIWGTGIGIATEAAAEWENIVDKRSVTLTSGDGMKSVSVKYKDTAGNMSVNAVSDETELDTSVPSVTVNLRTADDSAAKPAYSNVATLAARFSPTDDSTTDLKYIIYGDFTFGTTPEAQGITEAAAIAAGWKDYVPVSGQTYMLVNNMVCTTVSRPEGELKTVYVKIKDNAGNISDAGSASFTYDNTAPEVTVSGVDYTIISKVNTKRQKVVSGEVVDDGTGMNDEVKFTFTPNGTIQAYQVCAYTDQTAAIAGDHTKGQIGTAGGSTNMSASGISSAAAVNAMIKGSDYEAALPGETTAGAKDGAHIVVVYVQDLGGTWSAAAEFNVSL